MMDQKTYNDLMNFLIKAECKRIEKDKQPNEGYLGLSGHLKEKRPSSTLKKLGPIERHSNNPAYPGRNIY